MKNYLKTGIVLIGISLLLWNCKYDDELIIHENEVVTNSKYSVPEISNVKSNFEVFETQHKIFSKNIKSTASKQNGNDGIYIDWENSKKYKFKVNENIDILYTPIIYNKKGHRMKSLLASVENEGLIESFIFTLIYDESSTKTIFSGLIYKHDIEGNFIKVYKYSNGKKISEGIPKTNSSNINKNTSNKFTPCDSGGFSSDELSWMAGSDILDCVTIIGSAGSSSTDKTSWSDTDLNLSWGHTPIPYVNTPDTAVHGTSTTNTVTTNVPSSTAIIDENWYSEVTSAEALLAVKVIKSKLTLNAEQTTWVENSVNNNMSSWQLISLFSFLTTNNYSTDALNFTPLAINAYITSSSVDYVDRIILDATVTDCVKNIIDALKIKDNHSSVVPSINDQPVSHISQAILDLFDSSTKYNLNFSIEQLGTDDHGNEVNGETKKLAPDFTSWSIKIDSDLANNGTQLFIAKTLIHESIHAIIGYSLKEYRPSDFAIDLNNLYKQNGDNPNLTEHEFMSQYVEAFAYSLAAWDNHKQPMEYYKMLSWGGLETSTAYKELNNKTDIQNAIQNERYNKNNPKGTKCN